MTTHTSFQDKIVLVTGSTRGIGKTVAERFAAEGACVQITGRNEAQAKAVAEAIAANGGRADGYSCDVTNGADVQEIVAKILDKYSRIDIVINNAGITKDNLLLRMSEEDWNDVLKINLGGVFQVSKAVSKAMLKAKSGKIINISSIIGIQGNAGQVNYAASKAGIIAFTKSLAQEYGARGITVNAVAPGYIQTDMTEQLKEEARSALLAKIPLGRFGEADDVADVCLFLASEAADYITGQTIIVDGGMAVSS